MATPQRGIDARGGVHDGGAVLSPAARGGHARAPSAVDTPAFGATRAASVFTLPFVVLDEGFASAVQETRDLDDAGSAHRCVWTRRLRVRGQPAERVRVRCPTACGRTMGRC
jgi:hypothetical protein